MNITLLQKEFSKRGYEFKDFCERLEQVLQEKVVDISLPTQGLDNIVFFIKTIQGKEYAVKTGVDVSYDVAAYKVLTANNFTRIPKSILVTEINNLPVLVTEKINGTLYVDIPAKDKARFLPSIMRCAKTLHEIHGDNCGDVKECEAGMGISWKQYLLSKYDGSRRYFDWNEIFKRQGVDKEIVKGSMKNIVKRINSLTEPLHYSLLHTDLNPRNIFVDRETFEVTAIIDWTEAMYGDPLYEFARFRMTMRFSQPENEAQFTTLLALNPSDAEKEQLYYDIHMLDYVNWYSEAGESERLKILMHYLKLMIK